MSRPLFSFLLPKFSLASLERGHFLLSQQHEIVVQRLDEPSGHDTHPVVTPGHPKWGDAYLKHRFERDLEVQKSDFEHYREQLGHLADRGKRSNEMEFNAIKAVWEQFVEAFLATNACIAQMIQIPGFRSMSSGEFTTFLSATDFSDGQKQQLVNSQDREKTYRRQNRFAGKLDSVYREIRAGQQLPSQSGTSIHHAFIEQRGSRTPSEGTGSS